MATIANMVDHTTAHSFKNSKMPKYILLFSGKRKSGKDFITDILHTRYSNLFIVYNYVRNKLFTWKILICKINQYVEIFQKYFQVYDINIYKRLFVRKIIEVNFLDV